MGDINIQIKECVAYEKLVDTHAIATLTIPLSGEYKYLTWDDKWIEQRFRAGTQMRAPKRLLNENCPGFKEIKALRKPEEAEGE